jgi:hypothetical protein
MNMTAPTSAFDDKIGLSDFNSPIPEGLPTAPLWRLFAIPVRLRRVSKGGILLADDSVDAMEWHHQVYKGSVYKNFDISEDEVPKVGDLWLIDPKQPRRFKFKDHTVIVVNDDQLIARVNPESVEYLSFYGLSL